MKKLFPWQVPIKSICIDLDGTITEFSKSLDYIGKLKIGAREFLRHLKTNAFKITIYTSRPGFYRPMIVRWLKRNRVPFDAVVCDKPMAQFYIDDRAIEFKNSWYDVYLKVNSVFPEINLF